MHASKPREYLIFWVLVLLVVSSIPITSSSPKEKHITTRDLTDDSRGINLTFIGTMGRNGWYVSSVMIVITVDEINHVYYSFDNQTWVEYTAPILVSVDGYYTLYVLADVVYGPYPFKIDRTPPTISLCAKTTGHNKYRIWADVFDATSGVNRVDFYLNNFLIMNDTIAPYEWNYTGPDFDLDGIVYDNAGNSAMIPSFHPRRSFLAIGSIADPHTDEYGITSFFSKRVLVIAYGFLYLHPSLMINQTFAFSRYRGLITDHLMFVKYTIGYP